MDTPVKKGFATKVIHGKKLHSKHESDLPIRAISTPIFQSSTFVFESAEEGAAIFAGEKQGYVYTRLGNPTQAALESDIAYLENGESALAFGSGMAAISTLTFALAVPGDNLVAAVVLYGGTHLFFNEMCPKYSIEVRFQDPANFAALREAIDSKTRFVFIETPSNPTLDVYDIEAIAKLCTSKGVPLVVDNTFATPYLQNPLDLGAEIVVHSATKYLGGHGDTVAGIVIGKNDFIGPLRAKYLRDFGGIISPFNAWLILRGLKTLPVRMDRHCDSALEVAKYLAFHPKVQAVYYPGLRTHPGYRLASKQMRSYGGMLSFDLSGGREAGRKFCNAVKICTLAVSLGDVDTLISHPASMTHSTYSKEDLDKAGISEGLIRLSVGLENVEDIIEDLRQAMEQI